MKMDDLGLPPLEEIALEHQHPAASGSQSLHGMPSVTRMQQGRSNIMVLVGHHAALHRRVEASGRYGLSKCRESVMITTRMVCNNNNNSSNSM